MSNICCIIQARIGSTRLPGKVMLNVEDQKPILYFVIKQLQECKLIDKIIVATTTNEEDNQIVNYSKNMGINCFKGIFIYSCSIVLSTSYLPSTI